MKTIQLKFLLALLCLNIQFAFAQINITPTVTNVPCFGGSGGSIAVAASGGAAPYQYALTASSYGSTTLFNGLSAGTYTVYVRDANLAVATKTAIVTQPSQLIIADSFNTKGCGFITEHFGVSGGTTPYNFSGSLPAGAVGIPIPYGNYGFRVRINPAMIMPNATTVYTIQVVDAKGCTVSMSGNGVTLGTPVQSQIVTNATLPFFNNGSITNIGNEANIVGTANGPHPGYNIYASLLFSGNAQISTPSGPGNVPMSFTNLTANNYILFTSFDDGNTPGINPWACGVYDTFYVYNDSTIPSYIYPCDSLVIATTMPIITGNVNASTLGLTNLVNNEVLLLDVNATLNIDVNCNWTGATIYCKGDAKIVVQNGKKIRCKKLQLL